MRAFEYDGAEYALVNDCAHDFALLHYSIGTDAPRRQLEATGFRMIEMYDSDGNTLGERSDDRGSPWIWYVARRSAFTRAR